jgi:hypothetical protein
VNNSLYFWSVLFYVCMCSILCALDL